MLHGSVAPFPFPWVAGDTHAPSPELGGTVGADLDESGKVPCSGSPGSGIAHPGSHNAVLYLVLCPGSGIGSAHLGPICLGIGSLDPSGSGTEDHGLLGSPGFGIALPGFDIALPGQVGSGIARLGSGTARLGRFGSDSARLFPYGGIGRPGVDPGLGPHPLDPGSLGSAAPAVPPAPRSSSAGSPAASAGSQ